MVELYKSLSSTDQSGLSMGRNPPQRWGMTEYVTSQVPQNSPTTFQMSPEIAHGTKNVAQSYICLLMMGCKGVKIKNVKEYFPEYSGL